MSLSPIVYLLWSPTVLLMTRIVDKGRVKSPFATFHLQTEPLWVGISTAQVQMLSKHMHRACQGHLFYWSNFKSSMGWIHIQLVCSFPNVGHLHLILDSAGTTFPCCSCQAAHLNWAGLWVSGCAGCHLAFSLWLTLPRHCSYPPPISCTFQRKSLALPWVSIFPFSSSVT